ncbi:MAG: sodium/pantothenate symporter [Clostridia bacterium]|nr:sodium/pantothenate symporter [Clostridia bacterium]
MTSNQVVILAILVIYLVLNVAIGLVLGKKKDNEGNLNSEKKYFIGGRNMGGLILAMTTMATYTSVSSFISGPGAAGMTYGYAQAWVAAVQVPVTFLVLGVIGNKLALVSRRTGSVTIAGYLKARYKSDVLVIVTSLLMVVFFITQMVSQFTGGATLIQSITGIDYKFALLIFAIVVIIYTAIGGFNAVVITDTVQGLIMCLGTFLFLFFVLKAGGGLANIDTGLQENLPGIYDNLTAVYKPGTLLSFWVLVGFGTLGLPQTAVRAMGFKSTKSLHKAMIIGAVTCSFVIVGMHLGGVWAGALTDGANLETSDYFLPYVIQKIMPAGIAGIFLAAPMAAVMSTVSSLLILVSAAIIKDLWRTYIIKDNEVKVERYNKNVKKVSAIATGVFGLIVAYLSLDPPDIIFFLNLFAMGGLECAFFWPLIGGLFWKKGTKQAAVASSLGAAITYVYCYYNVSLFDINAVVWGLLVGAILYFAVGKFTCKNGLDEEIIEKCF